MTSRIVLMSEDENDIASLAMYDKHGASRVGISAFGETGSSIALASKKSGDGGIVLGIADNEKPALQLYDPDARRNISLGTSDSGNLGIQFNTAAEGVACEIAVTQQGSLSIYENPEIYNYDKEIMVVDKKFKNPPSTPIAGAPSMLHKNKSCNSKSQSPFFAEMNYGETIHGRRRNYLLNVNH